jgi:hypothetical protein
MNKATPTNPPYWFVFDVESIGLHGEGFAVAFVVVTPDGDEVARETLACAPSRAEGSSPDRDWVAANVPAIEPTQASPFWLRDNFWQHWLKWSKLGAVMAADVAWPVEAHFLNACVNHDRKMFARKGPYPLIDIASVRLGAGLDPLATEARLPSEESAHHPLGDARQSARLLIEALRLARAG